MTRLLRHRPTLLSIATALLANAAGGQIIGGPAPPPIAHSDPDLLVIGEAFRMVAQHLQHPTVGGVSTAALADHARKLGAQRLQPVDALFDLAKLTLCYRICPGTGLIWIVRKAQKFLDRLE